MIVLDRDNKNLVVPKSLGNFGTDGGSGSGMTPEEVQEMINSAITDYDTEIQVDLEDIRENVSGNSEDIVQLSGATVALKEQVDNLSLSGITSDVEALSAATIGISSDVENLSGATNNIISDVNNLSAAVSGVTGDVDTLSAATSGIVAEIEVIEGTQNSFALGLADLSGTTSGIAINLAALSGATVGIEGNLNAVSGAAQETYDEIFYEDEGETYSQIDDLWGALGGKQDVLEISSGLTIDDNTVSANIGAGLQFDSKGTGKFMAKLGDGMRFGSGDTISLNIGEGLGFSGDTLVVSGIAQTNANLVLFDFPTWTGTNAELYEAIADEYYNNKNQVGLSGTLQYAKQGVLLMSEAVSGNADSNTYFNFNGTAPTTGTGNEIYIYRVTLYKGGATSGASNKIFSRQATNKVFTASPTQLGGVKIGSGVTMSGDFLSVKYGDGLGMSGDTLVVSGGTGNATPYYIINDILTGSAADIQAFYNAILPAISGTASEGLKNANIYYRYAIGDTGSEAEFNLVACTNAWVLTEGTFGEDQIVLYFDKYSYMSPFGNGFPDSVAFNIKSDGTYTEDFHGGSTPIGDPNGIGCNAFKVNTAGTIVDSDMSFVTYGAGWRLWMMNEQDQLLAPVKWINRYLTDNPEYPDTDPDNPSKTVYQFGAEVPINGTLYSGIWSVLEGDWYSGSVAPTSWTSGSTIPVDPNYPVYTP